MSSTCLPRRPTPAGRELLGRLCECRLARGSCTADLVSPRGRHRVRERSGHLARQIWQPVSGAVPTARHGPDRAMRPG